VDALVYVEKSADKNKVKKYLIC